jgi:hypothetical protein
LEQDAQNAAHLRHMIVTLLGLNEVLLTKVADGIKTLEPMKELDPEVADALTKLYKQLHTVTDFERQLVKQGYLASANAGATLDLEEARAEVARRVDRLRAALDRRGAD